MCAAYLLTHITLSRSNRSRLEVDPVPLDRTKHIPRNVDGDDKLFVLFTPGKLVSLVNLLRVCCFYFCSYLDCPFFSSVIVF